MQVDKFIYSPVSVTVTLFIKLILRELECVPDIWSLIEWSNWLTPRNSRRRYDTVFYMCFVESKPPASADGAEVISSTVRISV